MGTSVLREALFVLAMLVAAMVSFSALIATKNPVLYTLLVVGLGLISIQFVLVFHDCMHGSLFKRSALHTVFGRLIGTLYACPYHFMRWSHIEHHTHAGASEKDTEILHFTQEQESQSTFARIINSIGSSPLSAIIFAPILQITHFINLIHSQKSKLKKQIFVDVALIVCFQVVFITMLVRHGIFIKGYVFGYISPYLIGLSLTTLVTKPLHSFTIAGNAAAQNATNRQFFVARTIDSNALIRAVFFNLNYHLEHHLHPKVSRWNLGTHARQIRMELTDKAARENLPLLIHQGYRDWYASRRAWKNRFNPVVDAATLMQYNRILFEN